MPSIHSGINNLSGGWLMRIRLACVLFSKPDLLLLDEPTNHLDSHVKKFLAKEIREYPGTVIIISHDQEFLNSTVSEIIHLNDETKKLVTF
jgi:ATP-binding cassette subfamily F protein 3